VKQIYETRDETYDETSGKTCKRTMKSVPKPTGYICSTWRIITTLSKYVSNPGIAHWQALMHVLRYIKETLHYKITYSGDQYKNLQPIGWVDADYGGDVDLRRLCAGYVFIQAGGPTSWSTQYQPTVALSTMEAEYMAILCAAKQILWMYLEWRKLDILKRNLEYYTTITQGQLL
jgi:hypothetical protein